MKTKQKNLDGSATVVNRKEVIQQIFENEGGFGTLRQLAIACDLHGVFDEEFRDKSYLKAIESECRKAIKQKDKGGLPFGGPVRRSDGTSEESPPNIWVQRRIWENEDYLVYLEMLDKQVDQLQHQRGLLEAERFERFGNFS